MEMSNVKMNSNEFLMMKNIIEQLGAKINSLTLQSKIQNQKMIEKDKKILQYKLKLTSGGRTPFLSKQSSKKTLSKSPIRSKVNGKTIFTQTPSSFVL